MRINIKHTDRSTPAWTLADRTSGTARSGASLLEQVDLLPYIGAGTFLVAALLRSSPRMQSPR
jgi:hypothetical protein